MGKRVRLLNFVKLSLPVGLQNEQIPIILQNDDEGVGEARGNCARFISGLVVIDGPNMGKAEI